MERLSRSAPTGLGRSTGADLVDHYLSPARRPPRPKQWSVRHRDEQTRYCHLYVLSAIGEVLCRELTRDDLQVILDKAPTRSVAKHIKACLTGLVNAGLEEGHLLGRQDLLRGVRWNAHDDDENAEEPSDHAVSEAEIPNMELVHALAARTAGRRLGEVEMGGLVFPAPRCRWQRRSNYSRNVWDRAATDIGWPRRDDGRWLWTFHSLRHVFATWALHEAGIPIEDLSRLLDHSSTR